MNRKPLVSFLVGGGVQGLGDQPPLAHGAGFRFMESLLLGVRHITGKLQDHVVGTVKPGVVTLFLVFPQEVLKF